MRVGDGARGDAPRLRVADEAAHAAAELEADLRQLRRLAGTGLAADDDDGMLADRARDLVPARRHRQLVGKLIGGRASSRCRARRGGRAHRLRELEPLAFGGPLLAQPRHALAQAGGVCRHGEIEVGGKRSRRRGECHLRYMGRRGSELNQRWHAGARTGQAAAFMDIVPRAHREHPSP